MGVAVSILYITQQREAKPKPPHQKYISYRGCVLGVLPFRRRPRWVNVRIFWSTMLGPKESYKYASVKIVGLAVRQSAELIAPFDETSVSDSSSSDESEDRFLRLPVWSTKERRSWTATISMFVYSYPALYILCFTSISPEDTRRIQYIEHVSFPAPKGVFGVLTIIKQKTVRNVQW